MHVNVLRFLNFDLAENAPKRLTAWLYTAGETSAEEFLSAAHSDGEFPHTWGPAPDVVKRQAGKLATPA